MLFPLSVTKIRNNRIALLIVSLGYTAYVLYPAHSPPVLWITALIIPVCAIVMRPVINKLEHSNVALQSYGNWKSWILLVLPLLIPLLVTFLAETLAGKTGLSAEVIADVKNDHLSIFVSGFLLAVFVGGLLVSYIVYPLAQAASGQPSAQAPARLLEAGSRIGWLERGLFFVFFVGGAPEAAALALAAKAFVRAPEAAGVDAKSEYYLVGSLASVSVALTVSVVVRLALGRSAI
jgi:hypothetical protein